MSSGIIGGDPSSLSSQTYPSDSPNAPESRENATNFSTQPPTGGLNDQNEAAGTSTTNGSQLGSDRPQPPQPSDEISMELIDFGELNAKVEEQRERSVQNFHAQHRA
ncbi:hypothetical protein BGZ93_002957 [Podila epicladia]|nr:hypothetical protein BGZ93_002957 [Podila epicladia]